MAISKMISVIVAIFFVVFIGLSNVGPSRATIETAQQADVQLHSFRRPASPQHNLSASEEPRSCCITISSRSTPKPRRLPKYCLKKWVYCVKSALHTEM